MQVTEATMVALMSGKALRRPSMPAGMRLIPTKGQHGDDVQLFLAASLADVLSTPWQATVDDLVAGDWVTVPRLGVMT